eukprot:CAMPEP_0197081808 /NCGR_PEP_ID=MMETSP1384-20130603/214822_1 /TAXON_ID=29189 /ORGANISM="Ammonia sp." /LENGTH=63 /DNA_ID=CAMNT_0042520707 /DNA_START=363 /DNA_END=555 /DNA_ORIENTATION=+
MSSKDSGYGTADGQIGDLDDERLEFELIFSVDALVMNRQQLIQSDAEYDRKDDIEQQGGTNHD